MLRYFLAFLFFLSISESQSNPIDISAKQALLIDLNTDTVLYNKNAQKLLPPSSMLKMMTAYMVFEELKNGTLKLNDKFYISKNAWRKGAAGSRTFLDIGSKVSIEDLLNGLIVQSGNDAAVALAEGIAGTEQNFSKLMNAKAKEIGANTAQINNSSGLPDENPLMSAYDLATIAKKTLIDFPELYKMYKETSFTYNGIQQTNRNPLLYMDIGCDGLKTGQTDAGGLGLVASVKQGERRLLLVINGCNSKKDRASNSKRLINWGFKHFITKTLLKANNTVVANIDTWDGVIDKLPLISQQDIKITVPKTMINRVKINLIYNSPVIAPIKKGQAIASLAISIPGQKEKIYPLVAGIEINRANIFSRFISSIKNLIFGTQIYKQQIKTLDQQKIPTKIENKKNINAESIVLKGENMHQGKFITFEGGEGSGKSTQIEKLSDYLKKRNIPHIITREPGGTVVAEQIRKILVSGKSDKMDPLTEYLLFSAARREHIEKIIRPALKQKKWVLCDRFYDSSYVYQGIVQNLSLDFIELVYKKVAEGKFKPDVTFIFDLDAEVGLKRTSQRIDKENRFENKGIEFHNNVRNGFMQILLKNQDRCIRIDANSSTEKVFEDIQKVIKDFIPKEQ